MFPHAACNAMFRASVSWSIHMGEEGQWRGGAGDGSGVGINRWKWKS
jgi:hypothetical protein